MLAFTSSSEISLQTTSSLLLGRDTSTILWLHHPRRLLWSAPTPRPSKRTPQDRAQQQHFLSEALLASSDSSRAHTRRQSWTMSWAIAGHPSTSNTLLPKSPLHKIDSCTPSADHISLHQAPERSPRLLCKPLQVPRNPAALLNKCHSASSIAAPGQDLCHPRTTPDNPPPMLRPGFKQPLTTAYPGMGSQLRSQSRRRTSECGPFPELPPWDYCRTAARPAPPGSQAPPALDHGLRSLQPSSLWFRARPKIAHEHIREQHDGLPSCCTSQSPRAAMTRPAGYECPQRMNSKLHRHKIDRRAAGDGRGRASVGKYAKEDPDNKAGHTSCLVIG